jgi:hypothetical protein
MTLDNLIDYLRKREDTDYRKDRALSDGVLIAAKWMPRLMDGEIGWTNKINPINVFWEPFHPNPVHNTDNALGLLPPRWLVMSMRQMARYNWVVECHRPEPGGGSFIIKETGKFLATVISVCVVRAWEWENEHGEG